MTSAKLWHLLPCLPLVLIYHSHDLPVCIFFPSPLRADVIYDPAQALKSITISIFKIYFICGRGCRNRRSISLLNQTYRKASGKVPIWIKTEFFLPLFKGIAAMLQIILSLEMTGDCPNWFCRLSIICICKCLYLYQEACSCWRIYNCLWYRRQYLRC